MPEDIAQIAPIEDLSPDLARAEIDQCLRDWIEAVNRGNAEGIGALYATDAILLATFDPRPLTTPAARQDYFINFKARKYLKASVDKRYIKLLGDNAATANGIYTFTYFDNDAAHQIVKARFSFTYARQPDGDWLIAAHHSSVAPAKVSGVKA